MAQPPFYTLDMETLPAGLDAAGTEVSLDDTWAETGEKSLKVSSLGSTNSRAYVFVGEPLPVRGLRAGATYTASVATHCLPTFTSPDGYNRGLTVTTDGDETVSQSSYSVGGHDQRIRVVFTIPEDAATISIALVNGTEDQDVWFDNFQIDNGVSLGRLYTPVISGDSEYVDAVISDLQDDITGVEIELVDKLSRIDRTQHAPSLGLYFPEAEGALADGESNDGPAIEAALGKAALANGEVQLGPTTYYLGGKLSIPAGGTLKGYGATLTAIAETPRIVEVSGPGVTIEGVTIEAGVLATSDIVRIAPGADDCRIHLATFTSANTDPGFWGVDIRADGADVSKCIVDGASTGIQLLYNSKNTVIDDNVVRNWSQRGIYARSTATDRCENLNITNNRVTDLAQGGSSRYPIRISGDDGNLHQDVTVSGNYVKGTGTSWTDPENPGTADQISLTHCDGLIVKDNWSLDGGDAAMTISLQNRNVVVSGNILKRSDSTGLYVGSNATVYQNNTVVSGNVIIDCALDAQGDRANPAGIVVQNANGAYIEGNVIGNDEGGTLALGIRVEANSSNIEIGQNVNSGLTSHMHAIAEGAGVSFSLPAVNRVLDADVVVNNTDTHVEVSSLKAEVEAEGVYEVYAYIAYQSSATADISFGWNHPGFGSSLEWVPLGLGVGSSSNTGSVSFARGTTVATRAIGGWGNNAVVLIQGFLEVGTTTGDVALTFAQNNPEESDTIIRALSRLRLTRIA